MRRSQFYWHTYKETPSDAEIISHKLLLRAGLVMKSGQGLYSYLPMGLRVLRKIENLVREEMNQADCHELLVPFVTAGELWKESGRFEKMEGLMIQAQDRAERDVCLSPTNEEAVVDVFRKTVSSYKELPLNLYQINTKFRDEIRPRFGLMRAREFLMKDGYSFHETKECLDQEYEKMFRAYSQVFKRAGLNFIPVKADGGAIAGAGAKTHEFQVIADSGEDALMACSKCDYAANSEQAETQRGQLDLDHSEPSLELVETPNTPTIESVCKLLSKPQTQSLKSLVYTAIWGKKEKHFLLLLLGDDELNELKLKNRLKADHVMPSTEETLQALNLPKGYIGPVGLTEGVGVFYDTHVDLKAGYSIGGLQKDKHYTGFIPARDDAGNIEKAADLRLSQKGDSCPQCQNEIVEKRGIEVGHIFQLGDKYTKAMNVAVLDRQGKHITPLMGTYGIGVSRLIAAAIEQSHDEHGIIWPKSLCPFDVYFAVVGKGDKVRETANEIYQELQGTGLDILFDDRNVGPGLIFKDADLIGLPIRVVLGERDYSEDQSLEIKLRKTGKVMKVKRDQLVSTLTQLWSEL